MSALNIVTFFFKYVLVKRMERLLSDFFFIYVQVYNHLVLDVAVGSCQIRISVVLCLYCANSRKVVLEPEGKCMEILVAAPFP